MSSRGSDPLEDDSRIPVANQENAQYQEQITKELKLRDDITLKLSEHEDRIRDLTNHMKNVQHELDVTSALLQAKKKDTAVGKQFVDISKREVDKLRQVEAKTNKELQQIKDQKNAYEQSLYKLTQRMEEIKLSMKWDQKKLDKWLEECKEKEENSTIFDKYSREDEAKIKELNMKLSSLTEQIQLKKKKMDSEHIETQAANYELDKISEEFRKCQKERQDLIQKWEDAIDQMRRRDTDMEQLANELSEARNFTRDKRNRVNEKESFEKDERNANESIRKNIELAERFFSRIKQQSDDMEKQKDNLKSELDAMRKTLDRTAGDLESLRAHNKQLKTEISEKTDKIEIAKAKVEETKVLLDKMNRSHLDSKDQAKQMELLMQEEKMKQKKMEKELVQLREMKFKKSQFVIELKRKEKQINIEIQSLMITIKNLDKKIKKNDVDSLKQLEILYSQEFNLQLLGRKLNKLEGAVSIDESLKLEEKLRELNKSLAEKKVARQVLITQNKVVQDEVRRVKKDCEKTKSVKSDLSQKYEDMELFIQTSQKLLQNMICEKQNKLVEENFKKLTIKKMRDALFEKADEVLNLGKQQLKLKSLMEERKREIGIHMELLGKQVRNVDDEKRQISGQLHEKMSKVDKLRKRYEIILTSMAEPDVEGETTLSHFILKIAQEKEYLKRTGDELDQQISTTEREIKALANTIKVLVSKNEICRHINTSGSDADSGVMSEREGLEEEIKLNRDRLRFKKKKLSDWQKDLSQIVNKLEEIDTEIQQYSTELNDKNTIQLKLNKELSENESKLERVQKMETKYLKEIRSTKNKSATEEENFIQ